jgi:hypothetical protein
MLCIDYYEACQRKNRANSWNDCHSRVEVSRQQAQKKICWDFVHALLELAVWLQAGEDRAIAAGSKVDLKSGCPRLPQDAGRTTSFLVLDQRMFFWASYVVGQDIDEVWWPTGLVSGYNGYSRPVVTACCNYRIYLQQL